MKLTRLRLIGFKSFVEPTDFLIEPGLTGVVGPNGCGKSNLVEALRWVMGETSHKSMRAVDMDDVIFSGSNTRPGRNTAEVAIAVDNTERAAPAAFNEHEALEVSRRIEREKGSTYRINGREVRARDVHILFADASTGSRSPALVHQGRIGEIIQAKPEARRRVLEEAAGISGLHARRHEAELRLKAAEQNLQRLEDIIGQLAGQMSALKRQAREAVRYRNVSGLVRRQEAMLFHLRWVNANGELADAQRARDLGTREVAAAMLTQSEAAKKQEAASAALPPLREAEAKAGAVLQRLIIARETLDREETRANERLAELDRRLVQLDEDIERERQLAKDADWALKRLAAEKEALESDLQAGAGKRAQVDQRVAEADSILTSSEKLFGELTGALADLTARRNQLELAAREQDERLSRLAHDLSEVEAELSKLDAEGKGRPNPSQVSSAVEAAQAAITQAESAALRTEAGHSAARQALDVARRPLAEAERRAQRLETEAKTLAKVLHVDAGKLWPAVIDDVKVEKGYEAALGAALGDDLDAPVDPKAPMRWGGAEIDPSDPALPEGVEPLTKYVAAPKALGRRLRQVGVIERAAGARLLRLLKPGQRLVSREGDLWRWDGFAVAANAPTGAARRLAERNRLAEIETELQAARVDAESKRKSVSEAEAEVATAAKSEADARARWRELQHQGDKTRERQSDAERAANQQAARRSALTEAKTRISASRREADAAKKEALRALAASPPATELEAKLKKVRGEIAAHRTQLAEARAEAQALAREAEIARKRLEAIAAEQHSWTDTGKRTATQIAALDRRLSEARRERTSLADAPRSFEETRRSLTGEVSAAEAAGRQAADRLAEGEAVLADADRASRAALETLSAAREQAGRAEERSEGAKRRLGDIEHEIRDMLEVEPSGVVALAGVEEGKPLPEVAQIEAQLEKLRRDRERLGAVNLRAEEEMREVEGQHKALTTERDDLVEAIKRLRQGIQNLNREASSCLVNCSAADRPSCS